MNDRQFKEALDRWITKEQPMEDEEPEVHSFENGYASAIDTVIAYLQRKKLNYGGQKKFIDGIIRYIDRLKVLK